MGFFLIWQKFCTLNWQVTEELKYNATNSTSCFSYCYPACSSLNRPNPTRNKSAAFSTGRLLFYPVSCSNSIFGYGLVSNQTYFNFSLSRDLHFLLCTARVECVTNTEAVVTQTSHGFISVIRTGCTHTVVSR